MTFARSLLVLATLIGPTAPADAAARLPESGPDRILEVRGGVAARAHVVGDEPVPGDVFVLMGAPGSPRRVRIFDRNVHVAGEPPRPETERAMRTAAWTVARIVGHDIDPVTLTYSDGGGDSGGLAYVISYLDIEFGGAFTGEVSVAATGRVLDGERVQEVLAIDEKTVAADGAGADVVFVPAAPTTETVAAVGGHLVGVAVVDGGDDLPLAEQRGWDRYEQWGATRSGDRIDVVTVHHVGDVAAYLCGAGSEVACDVLARVIAAFDGALA